MVEELKKLFAVLVVCGACFAFWVPRPVHTVAGTRNYSSSSSRITDHGSRQEADKQSPAASSLRSCSVSCDCTRPGGPAQPAQQQQAREASEEWGEAASYTVVQQ